LNSEHPHTNPLLQSEVLEHVVSDVVAVMQVPFRAHVKPVSHWSGELQLCPCPCVKNP